MARKIPREPLYVRLVVKNESDALRLHYQTPSGQFRAERALENYIWAGANVGAMLQLTERVGVPAAKRVSVCKTFCAHGTGDQIYKLVGWIGIGPRTAQRARKLLVDKLVQLAKKEPTAPWLSYVEKSEDLERDEKDQILASRSK